MAIAWEYEETWDEKSAGSIGLPHGARCFYCHEPIAPPAIQWLGNDARVLSSERWVAGSISEIWLHPRCLTNIAAMLFRDLYEINAKQHEEAK